VVSAFTVMQEHIDRNDGTRDMEVICDNEAEGREGVSLESR
jgi:hypothetical protein